MEKKKAESPDFYEILKNKKVSILTLDQKWHELFPDSEKTEKMKALEIRLNDLLKMQGKYVNDIKDMKVLKKRLMGEILNNMEEGTDGEDKIEAKRLQKSQKLIYEINGKLKKNSDELTSIPYEIQRLNSELMVASMEVCYSRLLENTKKVKQIGEWVHAMREKLKDNILIKQDLEMKNDAMYTFMHNLLGGEVMDFFDRTMFNEES